eukprot:7385568-Prymnesium_polylepis.2
MGVAGTRASVPSAGLRRRCGIRNTRRVGCSGIGTWSSRGPRGRLHLGVGTLEAGDAHSLKTRHGCLTTGR